uniref:Variant surface glycoprotein 1125.3031 n=1 Tax=Trypanosoma brucei TaxID=5691 RepID=A0A1J0R9B3_9TRYP|nr:variant surface glycoprotein 1125.3031 [Trypanosoma brucei]
MPIQHYRCRDEDNKGNGVSFSSSHQITGCGAAPRLTNQACSGTGRIKPHKDSTASNQNAWGYHRNEMRRLHGTQNGPYNRRRREKAQRRDKKVITHAKLEATCIVTTGTSCHNTQLANTGNLTIDLSYMGTPAAPGNWDSDTKVKTVVAAPAANLMADKSTAAHQSLVQLREQTHKNICNANLRTFSDISGSRLSVLKTLARKYAANKLTEADEETIKSAATAAYDGNGEHFEHNVLEKLTKLTVPQTDGENEK